MKIIEVEDVEIEFQKQNKDVSCKWCVYVKVRHNDHDKLLFMIKTNHKPYTRFTLDKGRTVENFMPRLNAERSAFLRRASASDNDTLWDELATRVAAEDQGEQVTDSQGRVSTANYEDLKRTVKSWMLSYFDSPSGVADLGYPLPE